MASQSVLNCSPEPISSQLPILSLGSEKDNNVDSGDTISEDPVSQAVTYNRVVPVLCGSAVGELHVDKLLCSKGPSKWGSSKSNYCGSPPMEFEATEGKPKSRYWRKLS